MKKLLENAPSLDDPARPDWNRRLDETLTGMARALADAARQSAAEARRQGDAKAAAMAERMERQAREIATAGEG